MRNEHASATPPGSLFGVEEAAGAPTAGVPDADVTIVNGTGASLFDVKTANVMNALQDDGRTKTYRGALTNGALVFEVDIATQKDLWLFDPNVAGIDVIGDYLTEVNVTCPTCIRELDAQFSLDIGGMLMDTIAAKLDAQA